MMTDWSVGVETRNYRIPSRPDSRSLVDLLASMLCILLVAAALFGYLWVRSRIIALGYTMQSLEATEKSLERIQTTLIVEEEYLTSPGRIDDIARNKLGMQPLAPYQRIIRQFRETDGQPAVMVLAGVPPRSVPPRRLSGNN